MQLSTVRPKCERHDYRQVGAKKHDWLLLVKVNASSHRKPISKHTPNELTAATVTDLLLLQRKPWARRYVCASNHIHTYTLHVIRRESYVIRSKRFVRCDVDKSAEIGSRQILEECRKYMYKRLNLFESILASKTNHRQYRAELWTRIRVRWSVRHDWMKQQSRKLLKQRRTLCVNNEL